MKVTKVIKKLKLKPLKPEGGLFSETYRSKEKIEIDGKKRNLSTAIYYLLRKGESCKIHRLKSDEIYHFYLGDPVNLYLFYPDGTSQKKVLGTNILKGEVPQVVVPKMTFQKAKLKRGGKFALMGTTVSPGFDIEDFDMGKTEKS